MNLNELIEKNNKEFEEKFVRDDGLMDKYTWEGTKGDEFAPQPMANAIKSHLHASQLSIVEWMREWILDEVAKNMENPANIGLIGTATTLRNLLRQLNNLQ